MALGWALGKDQGRGEAAPHPLWKSCALSGACLSVQSLLDCQSRGDKAVLQRFMGIINYSGRFMTHLAVISEPLKGLLDEDIVCHGQVLCGGGAVGFVVLLV